MSTPDKYSFSFTAIADNMPTQPLLNAFIVFIIGMMNGYVFSTRPRLNLVETGLETLSLLPVSIKPTLVAIECFSFGLIALLIWLITGLVLRLLPGLSLNEALKRDAVSFLVFLVPPLAGHALMGGRSLYRLAFYAVTLLFLVSKWELFSIVIKRTQWVDQVGSWFKKLIQPQSLVFVCLAIFYILVVLGVFHPLEQPTGDEPNYLIIAHSLAMDQDIDLNNNYQDKDYRVFYSAHLHHRVMVDQRDRWLPSQGIGLPLALVPFYRLGLKTGQAVFFCRLFMTLLAVVCVYHMVRLLKVELGLGDRSLWGVVAIAGTSPFMIYGHQIYPEIPGALLLLLGCRFSLKRGRLPSLFAGFAAGLLPWLGIKFIVPLAAMMAVWFLWAVLSYRFQKNVLAAYRSSFLRSFTMALIMIVFFFFAFYALYGTFDFVKTHGIKSSHTAEMGGSVAWSLLYGFKHLPEAMRIAVGNLFDQRVGVFIYSPVYLLFLAGLVISFGQRHPFPFMAAAIAAAHWVLFAWTGQWEGFCPPTRYLVPLGPFFAYWIGLVFIRSQTVILRRWLFGLVAISIGFGLFIITHIHRFYHFVLWRNPDEKNHQLMILSNRFIDWTSVFPSFTVSELAYGPIIVFIGLTVIFTGVLLSRLPRTHQSGDKDHVHLSPTLVFVLLVIVVLLGGRLLFWFDSYPDPSHSFYTFSRNKDEPGLHVMTNDVFAPENDGLWMRGRTWTRFVWTLDRETSLTLTIHSLTDNRLWLVLDNYCTEVRLSPERKIVFTLPPHALLDKRPPYSEGALSFRVLWLHCERGIRPSDQSETLDRRFLGCYIEPK